jgi:very-short-patch-repair endonuclease
MHTYNPALKQVARTLRTNTTDSEQRLWSRLRRKQILGVQFYRQKPLGNYVVDFYAPSAQLVVEIDGGQHFDPQQRQHDQHRTEDLERQDLQVLRFTNLEVLQEIEAVVETIYRAVQKGKIPPSPPFKRGSSDCLSHT